MLRLLVCLVLLTPVVSEDILKLTVEEKSPVDTLVADLSSELNLSTNGLYSLMELLPLHRHLFTVDHRTGQLRTSAILDREAMCAQQRCSCSSCELIFQVRVQLEEKSVEKMIEIRVKDLNDHAPVFDQQAVRHLIHIKENVPLGYRIVLPSANDPDEGSNSVQSYALTGTDSNDFDVDFTAVDTPYLIVRSSLDRQRLSSYSFTLIASDHGQQPKPLSSSILLEIQILASNASIPVFAQSLYSVDVREDAPIATALLTVGAIDENDQQITYEFLTQSPFTIDRSTGQIQLNQTLDYERQQSYRLTVKAVASGIPAYAIVFVRVIDVNDNPVSIRLQIEGNTTEAHVTIDQYTLFIQEMTPIGTTLAKIILNDLDSFANGNPYLQLRTSDSPLPLVYKLIYQHNFQNTKLYSLILNQEVDREVKATYNHLQLIAHDSGTPTLHTQVFLTLNITDINDCIPTVQNNSTIYSINENNPLGLIIGTLVAVDGDAGQNGEVEYRLLNKTDLLVINAQTGEMSLNQVIDFETFNQNKPKNLTSIDLEFLVEVRDHGQPSLASETKVTLRIRDLNDNAPEFNQNQSHSWTLAKSSFTPTAVLGRITAEDRDSGLSGLVHYSIRSFNPCLTLEITSLGFVYLPSDSSIFSCTLPSYDFEIVASDYGVPEARSTRQVLTIHIDVNATENRPLPKLLPLDTQQTVVDIKTMGHTAFVLDLSTLNNHTYQPMVVFNNTHLSSSWNINRNGEVRLIAHPFASSYILSLYVIDEYTQESAPLQLQVKLCNSSIVNSCENGRFSDNRMLLIYAISFATIITVILVVLFSLIICLCCRKSPSKPHGLTSIHRHSFLHYMEDYNSEKTESSSDRLKSSSNSTIRDDDHDSACIIHGHSSTSSSSGLASQPESWHHSQHLQRDSSIPSFSHSSAYHYDLKLAAFLRQNQYPPCVHLSDLPSIPQSSSTDYGFSSLELSLTSSASTLPHQQIEIDVDQPQPAQRPSTLHSFVSSRECVV